MSALIIVDIEVLDPVRYEDYKRLASASIARHGGRYLTRGGETEVLDGTWTFPEAKPASQRGEQ